MYFCCFESPQSSIYLMLRSGHDFLGGPFFLEYVGKKTYERHCGCFCFYIEVHGNEQQWLAQHVNLLCVGDYLLWFLACWSQTLFLVGGFGVSLFLPSNEGLGKSTCICLRCLEKKSKTLNDGFSWSFTMVESKK